MTRHTYRVASGLANGKITFGACRASTPATQQNGETLRPPLGVHSSGAFPRPPREETDIQLFGEREEEAFDTLEADCNSTDGLTPRAAGPLTGQYVEALGPARSDSVCHFPCRPCRAQDSGPLPAQE